MHRSTFYRGKNMFRIVTGIVIILAGTGWTCAQDNPFKSAKVGDWVEYSLSAAGQNMTVKQTVKEKSETSVTMTTETSAPNLPNPIKQDMKVDLTKPYDPTKPPAEMKDAKVEKLGEGNEKITVGGKTYDCKWIKSKAVVETMGFKVESESKVWISKDVPLTGMVKLEAKTNFGNTTMELTGSGQGK